MQALLKILLLLFAIQLPLPSVGKTGSSYDWPEIQSTENAQHPLSYPAGHPNVYAIHHQSESPAQITNRIPQPQSTTERKNEPFRRSTPESVMEQWLIFWIGFGDLIEPGLTILKLIFPFHFFL